MLRVDVDGAAHAVSRDDGGVVRAGWPAFVRVGARRSPATGSPRATRSPSLESMKMESTVTAPFGGEVAAVEVAANVQVEAGAPLVRIRDRAASMAPRGRRAVDLAGLAAAPPAARRPASGCTPRCAATCSATTSTPARCTTMLTRAAPARRDRAAGRPGPAALRGRAAGPVRRGRLAVPAARRDRARSDAAHGGSTQEYLLSYLQWLDADRAGLPDAYRRRLERALLRYGVRGLERTPELEEAVVWMFRSFRRVAELVPVVTAILERRLRHRDALAPLADAEMRARLDRLAAAARVATRSVAELARDVRFHYFDEPLLDGAGRRGVRRRGARSRRARAPIPTAPTGAERIDRLVACPQPLRGGAAAPLAAAATTPGCARVLLEVYTRRFYRIRELRDLRFASTTGRLLGTADYDYEDRPIHLVAGVRAAGRAARRCSGRSRRHLAHGGHRRGRSWSIWRPGGTASSSDDDADRRRGSRSSLPTATSAACCAGWTSR